MKYRKFGNTDLEVSEIGFGAWAIGGPAQVGDIAIGWGESNDLISKDAIHAAMDLGINFFDTADFYGLGHSEELLGEILKGNKDVLIATKVGQRKGEDDTIVIDYSPGYIKSACELSLKRLKREYIDFYQLHTATVRDLENGETVAALENLAAAGKIRYWGISVNTFRPEPESEFMLFRNIGNGVQLVLNIINQKVLPLINRFQNAGFGVIARMPLQFGLLAKKFSEDTSFPPDDHRSFRLTPAIIGKANRALGPIWNLAQEYGTTPAGLSLSYILSYPGVSTVIPGMRNRKQVEANAKDLVELQSSDRKLIEDMYEPAMKKILDMMMRTG